MRNKEIDFIRGIAILSVILLHTLPLTLLECTYYTIHIGQAVPIFLIMTLYLSFRGISKNKTSVMQFYTISRIARVLKNVVVPFMIVVILQICLRIQIDGKPFEMNDLTVGWGGVGPGSYYLWVYLQFWLLIPFLYFLLDRFKIAGFFILLLICIALNVVCVRVGISDSLYRLICIRYLFLAVPAYMLLDINKYKKPIVCIMVLASILFLVYYYKLDLSPWVLDFGWASQQWPSYFWTMALFMVLMAIASKMPSSNIIFRMVCWMGENSWIIFLAQMFILAQIGSGSLGFIDNSVVRFISFTIAIIILSIIPAFLFDKIKVIKCHQK